MNATGDSSTVRALMREYGLRLDPLFRGELARLFDSAGPRVTPAGQTLTKTYPKPFTVARRGRTVYATRAEAMRDSRNF